MNSSSKSRLMVTILLVSAAFWAAFGGVPPARGEAKEVQQQPVAAGGGVSSSAHPLATLAGLQIMARGGNAIDAAVATAFALPVVEPAMSSIAGQGFVLIRFAKTREVYALDYYSVAPAQSRPDMFKWIESPTLGGYRFTTEGEKNTTGALSVAVPGSLAAFCRVLKRFGTLSLREVMQPAIDYAENGIRVTPKVAADIKDEAKRLSQFPASAKIFLRPDGSPLQTGDLLVQKDLAATYRKIAEKGEDLLYRGELGEAILRELSRHGGIMTRDDFLSLDRHILKERQPATGSYRDRYTVISMSPTSAGGIHIVQMLNLLEGFDLKSMGPLTADSIHHIVEAMKIAFADRGKFMGDPAFMSIPQEGLTSKKYAEERRKEILSQKTGSPKPGDPWKFQKTSSLQGVKFSEVLFNKRNASALAGESANTTHHSHLDKEGNIVAMTQSLGDGFGSAMVVPGWGVVLNNAMKLFDARPGRPNSIAPNKKMLSSMSPTIILKDGKAFMALGSPSGTRIINAVLETIINVIDFDMSLQEAIEAPRFHWSGDEFEIESRIPGGVRKALEEKGHKIIVKKDWDPWFGAVQAVMIDPATGAIYGGADPRRDGAAAGFSGGKAITGKSEKN